MKIIKLSLNKQEIPSPLADIPDPPKQLWVQGAELKTLLDAPCLAVVGSRTVTPYGKIITEKLVQAAASRGVTIISGLALGVDGLAHRAALEAGGKTIAVLPAGLDTIYPSTHKYLAKQILEQGGALISEYPEGTDARHYNFIARNRLVSGLAQAVLITEAAEKSGTLHTARFALEQGRDVLAVPGNITSPTSQGTNTLIKAGAIPITAREDILQYFKITDGAKQQRLVANNAEEQTVLDLIASGIHDGADLLVQSKLDTATFNQTLTMLEITGRIKPTAGSWYLL
jgi:DNA processing protein